MPANLLELRHITKRFFGVTVLDKVCFDLAPAEIHGLLGENGAGKSTLMKVLNGVLLPDEGEVLVEGRPARLFSPQEALRRGIGMVYQELHLLPHLSVAENIFASRLPLTKLGTVAWTELASQARKRLELLGIDLDVRTRVRDLSVAEQQVIAIARALVSDCRILVLDEPTSALPQKDVESLFLVLRRLKEHGVSLVFISHKLGEVLEITDRITVLRNGQKVGSLLTRESNEGLLTELVVGRAISGKYPKAKSTPSEEVLRVQRLSVRGRLTDISFSLRKGEILGIVGLLGAGKTEIAKAIFGVYGNNPSVLGGDLYLDQKKVMLNSPADAVRNGIGFVPENRANEGLLVNHHVAFNISLPALAEVSAYGVVKRSQETGLVRGLIERLRIKCTSMFQKTRNLSGGNQQKVVLAKWLATRAKLVILDEPTRGIDVGAKVEVYNLLHDLLERGVGVLLLSSEVPEVQGMADRILVLDRGRIIREIRREEVDGQGLQRLVMSGGGSSPNE
jgi:ABC-type sugar transport system ATPase subunit